MPFSPAAFAFAVLALVAVSGPVMAQTATSLPPAKPGPPINFNPFTRNSITVGGGLAFVPSYEGSNDRIIIPAANIRARISGINISTRGLQLGADFMKPTAGSRWDWQAGPVIGLNLTRAVRIIDPQVTQLGRRKAALEVGGAVGVARVGVFGSRFDSLGVRLAYVRDVSGIHNSYVLTPSIDYSRPIGTKAFLGMSLSGAIAGDGYARTYFAVDAPGAARSGLPVFANPRGGLKNVAVTTTFSHALGRSLLKGWSVFGSATYSRLQGDFAASPVTRIAGTPDQLIGAAGISYTF